MLSPSLARKSAGVSPSTACADTHSYVVVTCIRCPCRPTTLDGWHSGRTLPATEHQQPLKASEHTATHKLADTRPAAIARHRLRSTTHTSIHPSARHSTAQQPSMACSTPRYADYLPTHSIHSFLSVCPLSSLTHSSSSPCRGSGSGMVLIRSSMRRIVTAASVANLIAFDLVSSGSSTPSFMLLRTLPCTKSKPHHFRSFFFSSVGAAVCAAAWWDRSLANRSVASSAALMASCFGMTCRASANSAIASCSREPSVRAKSSRYMASAVSTAPPPAHT
mmetsp:Transcript_8481/g.20860  ORF Transcript_8481/g.20860 Transcript_8481/m.20860 type:complete len:278 (+) Transcript_8481:70-903(+)